MSLPIEQFDGGNRFLSNFADSPVIYMGDTYPTVEHAFQAAKSMDAVERAGVRDAGTLAEAKRRGRGVTLRSDWNEKGRDGRTTKEAIMLDLLRRKFRNEDLAAKLRGTGEAVLIEGNTWHDNFFGCCRCNRTGCVKLGTYEERLARGNRLGVLLMQVRDELNEADGAT